MILKGDMIMAYIVKSYNKYGEEITDEYIKNLKFPELEEFLGEVWARIQQQQAEKENISSKNVSE